MTPEYEIYHNQLMLLIEAALCEIILVEGKIKKVGKYGNSIIIKFENGNTYHQPLVYKYTSEVCLDETDKTDSK